MKRLRLAALVGGLVIAAGAGVISIRQAHERAGVLAACGATETGDWATVLAGTENIRFEGSFGRSAAECRCLGLLATGRGGECEALLEALLERTPDDQWSPEPRLAVHLIQTWRDAGRMRDAAALARRATRHFPDNGDLFYLELITRINLENEEVLLREMASRIDPRAEDATRMRTSLATRHLIRGDPRAALGILGPPPPSGTRNNIERWYDTRGMAFANAGQLEAVKRNYAEWRLAGGEPAELLARYALTLSISGLADPDHEPIELMDHALREADGVADDRLLEAIAIRLILTLVQANRQSDALEAYDRYSLRFPMEGLSREELERSAVHHRLAGLGEIPSGVVRFRIPRPREGETLLLSPTADLPVDADYSAHPLGPTDSSVEVVRPVEEAPLRWIYRDADHRVLASGTANPKPGDRLDVGIEVREPQEPAGVTLVRRPADGRRRILLIVLDCADWRITQYLRTRGELPVTDALLTEGFSAVLDSDPPLTAAAMEALVWPHRRSATSFVGLVHQLGVELAGLASVGENPFELLSWILPEDRDLFATVGAGRHSAANLLFSHGGIRAGRHSEVTGPDGLQRRLPIATSARDLSLNERARWPGLANLRAEKDAIHVRTIAAELDTAAEIVRAGEVDFAALRVEPLDILTHAWFAETASTAQDDGDLPLFELYRYIDARLGEIYGLLDEDDVLITMSDHGIRTAMEHSRKAMFVATGRDVPTGRAEGNPALRGVSAVVGDLLGVESDWPRTGVAPWSARDAADPRTTDAAG